MPWRTLLLQNLWWKLLAFALAVMIWSGAQRLDVDPFTESFRPPEVRSFPDVPIRVLLAPEQNSPMRVTPASVRLDVEGDPSAIRLLRLDDLMVFVDVSRESGTRPVEVKLPPGIKLLHLAPPRVDTGPITPPKTGAVPPASKGPADTAAKAAPSDAGRVAHSALQSHAPSADT